MAARARILRQEVASGDKCGCGAACARRRGSSSSGRRGEGYGISQKRKTFDRLLEGLKREGRGMVDGRTGKRGWRILQVWLSDV